MRYDSIAYLLYIKISCSIVLTITNFIFKLNFICFLDFDISNEVKNTLRGLLVYLFMLNKIHGETLGCLFIRFNKSTRIVSQRLLHQICFITK